MVIAFSQRIHLINVVTVSSWKSDLKTKLMESLRNDDFYRQIVENTCTILLLTIKPNTLVLTRNYS